MPFCHTCGKEVDTDQKFGEYCGSAQEVIPEAKAEIQTGTQSVSPSELPPQNQHAGSKKMVAIGGAAIILLAIVFFAVIDPPGFVPGRPSPSMPPTTLPATITSISVTTSSGSGAQFLDERYQSIYKTLFSKERTYSYGAKEVFSHQLINPPLIYPFQFGSPYGYE